MRRFRSWLARKIAPPTPPIKITIDARGSVLTEHIVAALHDHARKNSPPLFNKGNDEDETPPPPTAETGGDGDGG
jgi:hypothetical protein